MEVVYKKGFKIIGIAARTTNENGQSMTDIPKLWEKFKLENSIEKIPNKLENTVFSVYTNFEKDHTKPYDTIIGCKVDSLKEIPNGMVGQEFKDGKFVKYISKGNLNDGIIYNTWLQIWEANLNRNFSYDYEVFGDKAMDPTNAEVEIFVAVH